MTRRPDRLTIWTAGDWVGLGCRAVARFNAWLIVVVMLPALAIWWVA